MIFESIVIQSAGSFSVAVIALIMVILQLTFLYRKPQFKWYGWGAAISFSGMLYAVGIFLEYNALPGPVNRFGGLLEFTAVIFLIHCLYGFTFSYLGIEGKRYHTLAGSFHILLLIFLWSSDYIVADTFVIQNFIGFTRPFIEPDLGPLGPLFMLYAGLSAIGAITLWIRHKDPGPGYKIPYLAGMGFWILLGIHDGIAALGVPTFQYVMEYGFLGYSVVVLWVVFSRFVDISVEDKYRVITEFANDAILVIQDGKTVFGNPACSTLIGQPVTNPVTEDFLNVIVPEDRQKIIQYYTRLLHSVDPPGSLMINTKRAGHEARTVEIRANIISYRNRPAVLAVMRDITERLQEEKARRKSEEKFIRMRKMESLGLLAGGVAHDLNNVLAGIVSYPDLILMELPEDSNLRKPIKTMEESGKKAVAIVQDLLTVARGVAITKEPLNMNSVIQKYMESPEYKKLLQYHPTVTVKVNLDPQLLNIKGSPAHIGKVVMNLVSNASEAIEDIGNVTISTTNRYVDQPMKGYDEVNIGEYAVLVIEDDGPGISPEDLTRIFEPFYTKKVMGRSGTGLGLALVWNAVQDHDGYIDLITDKSGSRFELYFPITREVVAGDRKPSVPLGEIYGHGEMILVVDDARSQREVSCSMLERLGYKTKAVSGGEEAVDYLKEHDADLMLLDMIMDAGINGRETYERIKEINPEQKAIIVSGFADTNDVQETLRLGAGQFVKKPLILEELGMAVREELAK